MKVAICPAPGCDYKEEFEPDDFGMNYHQAVGTCPYCDTPTGYEDTSQPTKLMVEFNLTSPTTGAQATEA